MSRKYPAERIAIFAVYEKFEFLGNLGRFLKVAFPNYSDAEEWIEAQVNDSPFKTKDNFMIEEMPATMKAWKP